jgi:hypothetical protein
VGVTCNWKERPTCRPSGLVALSLTTWKISLTCAFYNIIRAIDWQRVLRIPYVASLERATTRLNECIHMANEGHLAQALDGLSEVVVNSATEAGMPLRVRRKGQDRFRKPFFNEECQRLKREWRRAGRQYGYQFEDVRLLERKYHSYVRSQKRAWLLAQLQDRLNMFHCHDIICSWSMCFFMLLAHVLCP